MVTPVDHSRIPVFQKFLNLYIDIKTIQTHFNYTPSLHIKHDIVFLMIFLQWIWKGGDRSQTLFDVIQNTRARTFFFFFFLPDIVNNMTNGQFTCTSIWRHLSAINITLGQHNYFLKSRLLLINHDNFFVISTNSHF